jgi:hypothetical protein
MAGSAKTQSERPFETYTDACRLGAPSAAFSTMLSLLETLRNLVVSGHEPASFLIGLRQGAAPVMVADGDATDLPRLRYEYGSIDLAFLVSARPVSGGLLLQVDEPTGWSGYALDQFCRRTAGGFYEALPYCWRRPSLPNASSAYQSTSGLIPNWGCRNSSLVNQRIC